MTDIFREIFDDYARGIAALSKTAADREQREYEAMTPEQRKAFWAREREQLAQWRAKHGGA